MNLEHYYWYFPSVLSNRFCDDIVKYGLEHQDTMALTGEGTDELESNGEVSKDTLENVQKKRKSNIVWMDDRWIYKQIQPYVHMANEKAGWNYQWDWTENCQFTKYDIGQYYGWHTDSFKKPNKTNNDNEKGKIRKLSMTISLNDGTEYDGGQLEFDFKNVSPVDEWVDEKIYNSKVICSQIFKKGSIVVFPSYLWHRVTPVTRGTRYSLVAWNLGWPFQ